jgi:hypothetical protein
MDENTGLPELPEGYFFRVTPWSGRNRYEYDLEVQLRRKLFIGSTKIDMALATNNPHRIYEAARMVKQRAMKVIYKEPGDIYKYVGDYPPKKLER